MEENELQNRIQQLEKENRILQKKLQRSLTSQIEAEQTNDRKEALLRKTIQDLQASRATIQHNHEKLQYQAQELEEALSNLKRTQAHLVQSEKMSSLGQLVAGVAHEINNPISFIYGNLIHARKYAENLMQLFQAYQSQASIAEINALIEEIDLPFVMNDFPQILRSMQTGAERIEEIVGLLRTFSRLDEAQLKTVDLHEGLDSTLMILGSRLNPNIEVIKHYGNLPKIECYASALNQVFLNLLSNAIDAVEHQDHPQITIQTEVNQHIQISIRDNGTGIPEDLQTQIFDPFFTTKPIGKGTGLGLSIAYQIITEQHHGNLRCASIVNQGTTFLIELPYLKKFHNSEQTSPDDEPQSRKSGGAVASLPPRGFANQLKSCKLNLSNSTNCRMSSVSAAGDLPFNPVTTVDEGIAFGQSSEGCSPILAEN
ncbi:ATPase, histidine kinase-, DNA gyrase B-, and HSP90-like domain protein [Leptolyngbya sp. NIES-3755]|nr:ATPase, histidine kinase-, DNA gyrase B-, and HSP90-like domain protein [Leptolyngbya sp. NIES-3755]